jgi:hypothetical protein
MLFPGGEGSGKSFIVIRPPVESSDFKYQRRRGPKSEIPLFAIMVARTKPGE